LFVPTICGYDAESLMRFAALPRCPYLERSIMSRFYQKSDSPQTTRRDFLKTGTAVVAGSVAANFSLSSGVYAAGSDILRIGLVGCGGRGTGAAAQALTADPRTQLVALGDVFADQLESSLNSLKAQSGIGSRVTVDDEHKFVGFDNYKQVIDSVDVVLLAETPHFRPQHLRAAVEAGKHVFCEKPVAVDAPGVRSVLETCKLAEEKGLSVVSGLCWRYHNGMKATFEQIHNGAIGEITALQGSYNSGGVWDPRRTREQCSSEMEHQLRNWYYYTWLSGDFNVEQHIHTLDKMAWAMKDVPPVSASGTGGRQQRTDPKYGNIYDHFSIVYEYANEVKAFCRCRHMQGCSNDVTDHIYGSKGRVDVFKHRIYDYQGNETWRFDGKNNNMYQTEHDELFASIRAGKPINNGYYMSMSTMLAIMGRMVAYTGKTLSWEQALNSKEDLRPPKYEWAEIARPAVAMPGVTPFV
jgi:predicted dehydrogenase